MLGEYTLISRVACWKILILAMLDGRNHWAKCLGDLPCSLSSRIYELIHGYIEILTKMWWLSLDVVNPIINLLLDMAFANDLGIFRQVYDWVYRFIGMPELPTKPKQSPLVRQSVVASNVQGRTSQLTRWKVTDVENKVYHPNVHFELVRI